MTPGARAAAAIAVLDRVLAGEAAEKVLTNWGRASRFAGSGDRAAVRDIVFDALRRRRSAAALGGGLTGRGLVLGLLRATGQEALFSGDGHSPAPVGPADAGRDPDAAEALDLPDWLIPALRDSQGAALEEVAAALRLRAPVFVRANTRKASTREASREAAQEALAAEGITAVPHPLAETALEVTGQARRLQTSQAYLTGLVELQDAASQAVALALPLTDGMRVLDHCAGGGGKTLAMGARAGLRLYAHDIVPRRMADLPDRARRAGLKVRITDTPESEAPFDLVLVDAPCSGSGSWRRDPEGKWALTPDRLGRVLAEQSAILDRASAMVGPKGALAYATCSILAAENGAQIDQFLARQPGWTRSIEHSFSPLSGGDGFYLCVLKRV